MERQRLDLEGAKTSLDVRGEGTVRFDTIFLKEA